MSRRAQTISELKSQLRVVVNNLRKLESIQSGVRDTIQTSDIQILMSETDTLLSKVERVKIDKILKIIEKRNRKRQNAKLRQKLAKQRNKISDRCVPVSSDINKQTSHYTSNTAVSSPTSTQKHHQQLRSYYDSNRFLQTFELLELLYKARVQDEVSEHAFSEKFNKVRSIWNVVRLENLPERNDDIENQWNTVLFGVPEKSYYKRENSSNDFIAVRRKWDSFITNKSNIGSSVPLGWVLPHENADPRWLYYRTN